jgi:hypothetical protein
MPWMVFATVSLVGAGEPGKESVSPTTNQGRKWRIGYVEGGPYQDYQTIWKAMLDGLSELGWIEKSAYPGGQVIEKSPIVSASFRGCGPHAHNRPRPLFLDILEDVSRLALQVPTYGFQSLQTDGPGLTRFEDREILRRDPDLLRQLVGSHLAAGEHDIQVDTNGHR